MDEFHQFSIQQWAKKFHLLTERKANRKNHGSRKDPFWHFGFRFLFLQFLFSTLITVSSVSGHPSDGSDVITQADLQGLQAFKNALVDPRGILRSWNGTGLGACSGGWVGIKCVRGQVVAIQLPWKSLGGQISEKVGQLAALRKLSLHDNAIGGQIPPAIGFLANLRGLYLFNNRFSGTIPPSIGKCLMLQSIDLSNNGLTGSIPSHISNSSRLYRLNLSYNNLSGEIPVGIAGLSSLTFLSLQNNRLSGSIPDTWGGAGDNEVYQLRSLSLDQNSFSGNVPISLSRLPMLEELSLSGNRLNGSIPEGIGKLSKLQRLDFSGNSIGGGFPIPLCNLSSLATLNLERNQIDGQIPEAIDGLKNLTFFSLKSNHFHGDIPATLGNISNLSLFDASDNQLTGEIPESLSHLNRLQSFNVSNNNLSGPVPQLLSEKFNSSSFVGNIELCGYSASVQCASPPSPPSPPSPTLSKTHWKLATRDIILIAAGAILAVLLLLCCVLLCCVIRKRNFLSKKAKASGADTTRAEKPGTAGATEVESGGEVGGKLVHFDGPMVFTADDLLCATAEIMGKSSYGTVYKATLEEGSQVAVKRLREKITKSLKEFETEVNALGKIRHPNLLALRAYYLGPKGEKLLVFDYMPKGSLAAFLHARGPDSPIDWPTRMSIAMGTARGLRHLHNELNTIHGNLTSANILLDENTSAKLSDYGLSRLVTAAASSNVVATASSLGYRAPELSKAKKANTKTDMYSLGVVMLELLTGKAPGEAMNGMELPEWVASIVKEEWTNEVFDLELMKDATGIAGDELLNTLKLALHCVDPSPAARPEVQQVLQQLEEIKPELAGAPGSLEEGGGDAGASTSME